MKTQQQGRGPYYGMNMRKIKCYGGPLHLRVIDVAPGALRIETIARHCRPVSRSFMCDVPPEALILPSYERVSYYIQRWAINGITAARSHVFKTCEIALYEEAELTQREQYDLEGEMLETLPWQWKRTPSILYEFERWWEKALNDNGVKKVRVSW